MFRQISVRHQELFHNKPLVWSFLTNHEAAGNGHIQLNTESSSTAGRGSRVTEEINNQTILSGTLVAEPADNSSLPGDPDGLVNKAGDTFQIGLHQLTPML